ncbi:EAL domain-containing protein [Idiomarina sp. HP20-50]|uniref:EAL domain-containing protein n=1 Tax=Idiomarina sp. HP20-50 TaxID=3070813 RepID=UPI00294AD186|nr:EAL domain-containing protein [Idiomarina sp. HP20-50]MDV6315286.1 EAL domain-containing protein [Idiomarina sp. HP20-50]
MQEILFSFFDLGQFPQRALPGSHNLGFVVLSYCVALLASYTAVLTLERVHIYQGALGRYSWLTVSAIIAGIGVWSMHFIGMLAFELNVPMSHTVPLTLLSVVPAIIGSFIALKSQISSPSVRTTVIGGTILGAGIGVMHYTGMAAMVLPAHLRYDPLGFFFSVVIAVSLGIIALLTYRRYQNAESMTLPRRRAMQTVVAAIMAMAISGMHYTAMIAANFYPTGEPEALFTGHSAWLAYAVGFGSCFSALMAIVATRIDHRLQQQQQLAQMSAEQLYEVISAIDDGLLLFDEANRVLLANQAFARLTGDDLDKIKTNKLDIEHYIVGADKLLENIQSSLARGIPWHGKVKVKRRTGKTFPVRLSISEVKYHQQKARHFVATVTDITAEVESSERIQNLAYNDALTGLANRRSLIDHLQQELNNHRGGEESGALIICDIDKFKILNNTLGSDMGDLLLKRVAERLKEATQGHSFLARLSANEFAVVLTGLKSSNSTNVKQQLLTQIYQLQEQLQRPYQLNNYTHLCSFSAGASLFNDRETNAETLMTQSGLALSHSKRNGIGEVSLFRQAFADAVSKRVKLEEQLRHAIQSQEFQLYLQPQVNSASKTIGAEALIRWPQADGSFISPADFIPLAEETGLIIPLGYWITEHACQTLQLWQKDKDRASMQLSINVSAKQFQQPEFVEQVEELVNKYQIGAQRLKLELTESLLMEDISSVTDKIKRLKTIGVEFALDDFGTGYSSLSYLMQIPFDTLKIDVSFVRNMLDSAEKAQIVHTIIQLGESLKLNIVAEGVETQEQFNYLSQLKCDTFQGYFFSKPLPEADFLMNNTMSS